MPTMMDYLKKVVESESSDAFVVAGAPVSMKTDGQVVAIDSEKLLPPRTMELIEEVYERARRPMTRLNETGDDDFSFAAPGLARFRVNAYKQRGSLAMVIRVVSFDIPDWQMLGIPEQVMDLANLSHGMILVTGTACSGKSTTEACIIDRINKTRACHVITLEDPIEYLHRDMKSIVSQREIAIDTENCVSALRACLRQSPDVIQVGEMRDLETIRAAVTAAETGHLLMATLHTNGAVNAIDRIVDTFPTEGQHQIRIQLSTVLHTVISQQLLPDVDGGRVPAFEIMHTTSAIRSLIRDCKTHQIDNAISTGAAQGMISMDQSILDLYKKGRISKQTALDFCADPEQMKRRLM
ncbi:MAG: PilT/PilU family type 4a pilus ATPase [Eubacteriales bacterium]|nr:PilT/PilU family type 4a pilus ATPase [Eubacteriales bacterium]